MKSCLGMIPSEVWRQHLVLQFLDANTISTLPSLNKYYLKQNQELFNHLFLNDMDFLNRKDVSVMYRLSQSKLLHYPRRKIVHAEGLKYSSSQLTHIFDQIYEFVYQKTSGVTTISVTIGNSIDYYLSSTMHMSTTPLLWYDNYDATYTQLQVKTSLCEYLFSETNVPITISKIVPGFIHRVTFSSIYDFCDTGEAFLGKMIGVKNSSSFC